MSKAPRADTRPADAAKRLTESARSVLWLFEGRASTQERANALDRLSASLAAYESTLADLLEGPAAACRDPQCACPNHFLTPRWEDHRRVFDHETAEEWDEASLKRAGGAT